MPNPAATLATALHERGIATPEMFAARYGVPPGTLAPAQALALIHRHEGRERADYPAALAALMVRLLRGLVLLDTRPTFAARVKWLMLANRAVWCIACHAEVSPDHGAAWCVSPVGEWYAALQWPEIPADVIAQAEREQRLPGWSQARAPPR